MPASRAAGISPRYGRQLRGDLDAILGCALAKNPGHRYATAQHLADDIQRHRAGLPVRARRNTMPYRLRKFIARYRLATGLAAMTVLCLVAGIVISTWQARVARRRFEDLRQFAHAVVFDVNDSLSTIPGTTAARKLVVETAVRYLDRLGREKLAEPQLREELAAAYVRIGNVQGGAFVANLGDSTGAAASFRKAVAIASGGTSIGLERLAIEAHISLARLATDPIQSLPEFEVAIVAAQRLLATNPNDESTLRLVADAFHGRATVDHITDRVADEEIVSGLEIAHRLQVLRLAPHWRNELALSEAIAQRALALEQKADYDGALDQLQRAEAILARLDEQYPHNQVIGRSLADKRSRAGSVLIALGRAAEAAQSIERGLKQLEPLVAADPNNAQYRGDLAYGWYRLAEAARADGRLGLALELHERALAARRERVGRDPAFTFIRWDLCRSLNAVAELVLANALPDRKRAAALFDEARALAARTLTAAPSFNELRKEVARAEEGLGRVGLTLRPAAIDAARSHLESSLRIWHDILARGPDDRRAISAPERVRRLLDSLPAVNSSRSQSLVRVATENR
jgi:non-specific serine/threonine protein kinase/serine/threonine-protein kinase